MRKRRTPQAREAICLKHKWKCGLCPSTIDPVREKWALDHIIPLAAGGSDDDDNLHPVHVRCHTEKTSDDLGRIAKINRVRSKHLGSKIKSGRPMPGTTRSGWKKKMNGQVERR